MFVMQCIRVTNLRNELSVYTSYTIMSMVMKVLKQTHGYAIV